MSFWCAPHIVSGQDIFSFFKSKKKTNAIGANLIFLIDISTSMGELKKFELAKYALRPLVDSFKPNDKISLLTFSNQADIWLSGVEAHKQKNIRDAIEGIGASGLGTQILPGLEAAYALAEKYYCPTQNNAIFILTDGNFLVKKETLQFLQHHPGTQLSVTLIGESDKAYDYLLPFTEKVDATLQQIKTKTDAYKLMETLRLGYQHPTFRTH